MFCVRILKCFFFFVFHDDVIKWKHFPRNWPTQLIDNSNLHTGGIWIRCYSMMTSSNGNIYALLAICAGNSPVPGEFTAQRPMTRSFDVFFDLRLNKRLSKQWWCWCPLWCHCNVQLFSVICENKGLNTTIDFCLHSSHTYPVSLVHSFDKLGYHLVNKQSISLKLLFQQFHLTLCFHEHEALYVSVSHMQ